MKIKDIIKNLDLSERNSTTPNMEEVFLEFDIEGVWNCDWDLLNSRLKAYWVANHLCTDTWVGITAIFLDEQFAGLSYQTARKADTKYMWAESMAENVKYFLLECKNEATPCLSYIDMDEDLGEGYPINYTGQMLVKKVLYKGDLVGVTKDSDEGYTNFHNITVRHTSGEEEVVDVRDILVPWYLKEEE